MVLKLILIVAALALPAFTQTPPVEPGVSHTLAKWRASHYSDVRYKLNLTLEKMSPVLKGTIEISVNVSPLPKGTQFGTGLTAGVHDDSMPPVILDWRSIKGYEDRSTISKVSLNGIDTPRSFPGGPDFAGPVYTIENEHIVFLGGTKPGENVIKLDFTSPILTSGSAITRYVDKEDGAEYIYSLFVPSDASTAFPVFDQPDLKARFSINVIYPKDWKFVTNTDALLYDRRQFLDPFNPQDTFPSMEFSWATFKETKPISTYVFAFAAGPFEEFNQTQPRSKADLEEIEILRNRGMIVDPVNFSRLLEESPGYRTKVYVRKSQAERFKPHAAEVFRLNREGIKYLESYFDYKFPFPKYDLVLIPEFPFGGMEHAGATFLREDRVIFPTEPTKNDHITRANLIFHEAAHQWFGDTVTMKWFDDLWLKEGFAEFMAYKALEKVMPEYNAWKIFYERNKQAAYLTDSTKGTTPIYQEIKNLNSAKSAYGNIVYRKAPSFLKQAEFYIGPDKFQTAVRAFLKKHEVCECEVDGSGEGI
ncbi:MAG: M1 family aminopeptidase [Pyrinomonadaceae bacterium]